MSEVLILILTGAVGAAGVKLIDNVIMWKLNRKAKVEDEHTIKEEELDNEICKLDSEIESLRIGLRVILLNQLRDLCQKYLRNGEIDIDDRRNLHSMHSVYHDVLGGNGDLDSLMKLVDELPLSQK